MTREVPTVKNPYGDQCHAEVHAPGNYYHRYQCSRKAVIDGKWCRQHSPEAVAKRDSEAAERQRQHRAAFDEKWRLHDMKIAALDAIRKIAAGHNDPRGLAKEVLEKLGDQP